MIETSKPLTVEYTAVDSFVSHPGNARTHSNRQIQLIASSIRTFGFTNPVLIDRNQTIVAGHGRVEAAKRIGLKLVPTILLDDLTEDQVRAYVIADNRLAEKAGWDHEILAIELQHLLTIESLDITVTGFEVPDIDLIIQKSSAKEDSDDAVTLHTDVSPITKSGDLWKLGKHRIFCGDALDEQSYQKLMGKRRAAVVFADPPYNIPIEGNVSGHGSVHHREFTNACGELNEAEFVRFLNTCFSFLTQYSTSGSIHFVCLDWRHVGELLAASKEVYEALLNICIWAKKNAGLGSFYRSQHEFVFVLKNGKARHQNNIMLGKYGRSRTNLWEYAAVSAFSKNGGEGNLLALHPTLKPVAMVADALLDVSARGDLVLDPFLGSGTTLIAAERVGRICHGIEIAPLYVDTAIGRWQKYTGDHAVHSITGKSFNELAAASEVQK